MSIFTYIKENDQIIAHVPDPRQVAPITTPAVQINLSTNEITRVGQLTLILETETTDTIISYERLVNSTNKEIATVFLNGAYLAVICGKDPKFEQVATLINDTTATLCDIVKTNNHNKTAALQEETGRMLIDLSVDIINKYNTNNP